MCARPASPARRRLLSGGIAAALVAATTATGVSAQSRIIVVSRERILREAESARRLSEAEAALTEQLQGRIDATKMSLAAEEEELARLRGTLPDAEFDARVADFDHRVRQARRVAQERAATLQHEFQDARAAILDFLPRLIERLRVEAGASIVLDAAEVLAMGDAVDLTGRAIALFNAHGPSPALPEVDLSGPMLAPAGQSLESAGPTEPDEGTDPDDDHALPAPPPGE